MNYNLYILLSNVDREHQCDYIEQTAKILSKTNTVIIAYYTKPSTMLDLLKRNELFSLVQNWQKIVFAKKNQTIHCNFVSIIPFQRFYFVYCLNRFLTKLQLSFLLLLRRFFQKNNLIFWIFNPTAYFFINKKDISIYDCVDFQEDYPESRDKIDELEKKLIQKARYVFTNSSNLTKIKQKIRKDIYTVPCGCAVDIFKKPSDTQLSSRIISQIKTSKPIIGLYGSLDFRIDYTLLKSVITNNPQWQFVFIGPVNDTGTVIEKQKGNLPSKEMNALKDLKNVLHIGQLPKSHLSKVAAYFRIGIIPYNIEFLHVLYGNPMKFYEYMALGIPVVTTPIKALKKYQSEFVKIGETAETFQTALQDILNQKNLAKKHKKEMLKIAQENSWEEKVSQILQIAFQAS